MSIKDVYGRILSQPKIYQEGGEVQHWLGGIDNPLQQQFLEQLQGLGVNIDPHELIAGQVGDIGGQNIVDQIRARFGIGRKIEMSPDMFPDITQESLEALSSGFYDPIRETSYDTLLDKFLDKSQKVSTGGFARSGRYQQKQQELKGDISEGMLKQEIDIDKLIGTQYEKVLGQLQDWKSTGMKLRYG